MVSFKGVTMIGISREIKFWTMLERFFRYIRYDKTTDIDGPDLLRERLYVRGKDINDLIGDFTFSEAIFHILQTDGLMMLKERFLTLCS